MFGVRTGGKAKPPLTELLGIDSVDTREYHGRVGDIIRIDPYTLFKIDKVLVAISGERAGVIEHGLARPVARSGQWLDAATTANREAGDWSIAVTAVQGPVEATFPAASSRASAKRPLSSTTAKPVSAPTMLAFARPPNGALVLVWQCHPNEALFDRTGSASRAGRDSAWRAAGRDEDGRRVALAMTWPIPRPPTSYFPRRFEGHSERSQAALESSSRCRATNGPVRESTFVESGPRALVRALQSGK